MISWCLKKIDSFQEYIRKAMKILDSLAQVSLNKNQGSLH